MPSLAQRRGGLYSFSPALARRRGGLLLAYTRSKARRTFLFLACTRSTARRTFTLSRLHSLKGEEDFFSFSPALAQRRGGLLLFLACTRSKARRTFSLSRPKTHESVEVFSHHWCLRSPRDDEDFKTLTTVADRRKTMGTLNF